MSKCRPMTDEEEKLVKRLLTSEYNYWVNKVNRANETKRYPKDWDQIWGRLDDLDAALSALN